VRSAVGRLPALGFALVLLLYGWSAAGRLRASRILLRVERTTIGFAASQSIPRAVLASNIRLLREAMPLDPLEVGLPVALGGQYLLLDRSEAAIAAYQVALELEQRPEIFLNLGRAYALAGDQAAARASFHDAVQLAPRLLAQVPSEQQQRPATPR